MNAFEYTRKLEKINPEMIREIGVASVHQNEDVVISDSIVANIEGKTFLGNQISEYSPFSDWEETGEFHEKLNLRDANNIEFTSSGDGAKSIFAVFPFEDTIAPSANTLDNSTLLDIKKTFINILNEKIK